MRQLLINYADAHETEAQFFTSELNSISDIANLQQCKVNAITEVTKKAAEFAGGDGFTLMFSPWQTELIQEMPKITRFYMKVLIFTFENKGAAST